MNVVKLALYVVIGVICGSSFSYAQTGCTPKSQAANLTALRDGQAAGSITPQTLRDLTCSTVNNSGGDASATTVTATGGSTARTEADRNAEQINVKDYGATGDGVTDDSAAISAAETHAMSISKGQIPTVYFPAGSYILGSGATLPLMTHPVRLKGDGTHKTYIVVSTSYVGDVFSFSEIWQGTSSYVTGMLPTVDNAGLTIDGISVFGDKTSSHVNNAIALYDRNNFVVVRDFEAFYLNGSCLLIGATKNQSAAWVRESLFYNLRCNNTGTASSAAVNISSTTVTGGDATNELQFYGLNVFQSAGVGLSITNPINFSATRLISFFHARVELSGADNIDIGSASDAGQVQGIGFYGLESITPGNTTAGFYGLNVDTAGQQIYGVTVDGATIGPCAAATSCKGVNIGNVRGSRFLFDVMSVTGTTVTYGANIGGQVALEGNGAEQGWTYSYASGVTKFVKTPLYKYGDPSTASAAGNPTSVTQGFHDGSSTFGNTPGVGAVDLQSTRNSAAQVASGNFSCLIAGEFNTASGLNSCVAGGSNNTVTGNQNFVGGGQFANDRGRVGVQVYSPGDMAVSGDAQTATFVLSATCASCSSARLASVHGTPNTVNIANISNNQSYAMAWRCVARDVTTAGTDNATSMPVALLTRDSTAGSTALASGTPATVTRGTWTGGGFAFSADTTNGGINIAFTSPTGNTDTFHAVCEGHDAEVQ